MKFNKDALYVHRENTKGLGILMQASWDMRE